MWDRKGVDLDERKLIETWKEGLKTPEGRDSCVYALGMTIGSFLQDLKAGEVEDGGVHSMITFLTKLKGMLVHAGGDVSNLDGLWEALLEATKYEGPTVWELLQDDD